MTKWSACVFLTICCLQAQEHLFLHVKLGPNFKQAASGRLLVFVGPAGNGEVDTNPFSPTDVYVAAKEVPHLVPGATIDVDADDVVFPAPLTHAKPGDYRLQAVLDVGHNYGYLGRTAGDLTSHVTELTQWNPAKGEAPVLVLDQTVPVRQGPHLSVQLQSSINELHFPSSALSRFWGREVVMKGWVVLPPSYAAGHEKFPTVYYTHGFGATAELLLPQASDIYHRMQNKKMPEMIWVILDESSATGTHEFADSVNNGPWGTALTSELIPYLESHYRMDAKTNGRFLQGHSSGGWATLWLQLTYPKVFGGTWSTSPDPSDFHDFTGPDLYAPHANVYHKPDGTRWPLVRAGGKIVATMEEFVKLEEVLGDPGGQIASFEWVFSPRGPDGRPMQMFDRATGDVHPEVVEYWRDHYDIANLVAKNWQMLEPDLKGKIHLTVGTADTFFLDGAAHRLQRVLDGLHAGAHFTFIPDRTHFDLYRTREDREGLLDQIAAEMYAVARPR